MLLLLRRELVPVECLFSLITTLEEGLGILA